jgi:hypothetical protein
MRIILTICLVAALLSLCGCQKKIREIRHDREIAPVASLC